MSKSAIDIEIERMAEENHISIEVAAEMFKSNSEYIFDYVNRQPVEHNWVKRGIKVSCEGANHPHHSHFLV